MFEEDSTEWASLCGEGCKLLDTYLHVLHLFCLAASSILVHVLDTYLLQQAFALCSSQCVPLLRGILQLILPAYSDWNLLQAEASSHTTLE
jgi:hypothetical protein